MPVIGDPQGTQARAIDTERRYPSGKSDEPPASFRSQQLLVLALLIVAPVLVYLFVQWVR